MRGGGVRSYNPICFDTSNMACSMLPVHPDPGELP